MTESSRWPWMDIYGERDALPKALQAEVTEVAERPKIFQPLRFRDGEETEYP